MQCSVTVVNLVHDVKTETDTPVCHVLPGCSWREKQGTSGGDPQRVVHVRLPPAAGYLPYAQWARLPPGEKAAHWTLKRGDKLVVGAIRSLTEAPSKNHTSAARWRRSPTTGNRCCRIFM